MYALLLLLFSTVSLFSSNIKQIRKQLSPLLKDVPDAIEKKIIVSHCLLNVPEFPFCYNPAFIADKDSKNGTLIFRVDDNELLFSEGRKFRKSFLYSINIQPDLHFLTKAKKLDTQNEFAEDPRGADTGSTKVILYNENPDILKYDRHMSILETTHDMQPLHKSIFNYKTTKVEKNWTPLYDEKTNLLNFIYSYTPYTILHFVKGYSKSPEITAGTKFKELEEWKETWGTPRGGTQAIQLGDKFLTFFHSSFVDKRLKRRWFLMGAMLLDGKPPYLPEKISSYPIFSSHLYISDRSPTSPRKKFVLYPSGIQNLSESVIRLYCGINDSRIRVIDIDKDALLKSLIDTTSI